MDTTGNKALGLLVRGRFDSGDFAMFTGYGTVTDGGVTYYGAGALLSIGDAAVDSGSGKSGVSVTLSGIDPEILALAEVEEFQRRRVTVYLATFGDDGGITASDVFFDGLADDIESDDSPESPQVTMTVEPRSLDLARPRPFKYLPEDQKRRFAGDTFFDLVQAIQNREDTWGR